MDAYTIDDRLCDDAGMVDGPYLEKLNRYRTLNANPDLREPIDMPFACTGHAHHGGEHVRCTSPYHLAVQPLEPTVQVAGLDGVTVADLNAFDTWGRPL